MSFNFIFLNYHSKIAFEMLQRICQNYHFVIMTCWIWFVQRINETDGWGAPIFIKQFVHWLHCWALVLRWAPIISHLYLKLLLEFFSLFGSDRRCVFVIVSTGLFSAALLLFVEIHCIIKMAYIHAYIALSQWNESMSFQTFGMIHITSLESLQLEYLVIRSHKTASVPILP